MMLKSLAYYGATVSNLEESVAFYRDVLHMKVQSTYEESGKALEEATGFPGVHIKEAILSFEGFDNRRIKLIEYISPKGKQTFDLKFNDVGSAHPTLPPIGGKLEEAYDMLRANGVKFLGPRIARPAEEFPQRGMAFVIDPDGLLLELYNGEYHLGHCVSDRDKLMYFYGYVLGLLPYRISHRTSKEIEVGLQVPGGQTMVAFMVIEPNQAVEFYSFPVAKGKQQYELKLCDVGSTHVAFNVDDIEQAYAQIKAKGAKFISKPVHRAEKPEATMVYIIDPDGYVLELRQEQ